MIADLTSARAPIPDPTSIEISPLPRGGLAPNPPFHAMGGNSGGATLIGMVTVSKPPSWPSRTLTHDRRQIRR